MLGGITVLTGCSLTRQGISSCTPLKASKCFLPCQAFTYLISSLILPNFSLWEVKCTDAIYLFAPIPTSFLLRRSIIDLRSRKDVGIGAKRYIASVHFTSHKLKFGRIKEDIKYVKA